MKSSRMRASGDRFLRAIAVFKFFKSAALIAVSVGVFKLIHKDIGEVADHWIGGLRLDPGNRYVMIALAKVSNLSPAQIKKLGLAGLFYAGLFLVEGTGLWLLKPWAEWLTAILTATLIPVEIYEIDRHPTAVRVVALLINVAIVLYLIYRIRRRRAKSAA
jgi:uncharacterized membrane protein (DUF2068 family)